MESSKRAKQQQQNRLVELPDKLEAYQTPPAEQPSRKRLPEAKERQELVERLIQEAMARGEFDELPGKGKPLYFEESPYAEPGQELAFGLLKQHGFAPEWIERDKEIRQELASARQQLREVWQRRRGNPTNERMWQTTVARFVERLDELNRKIVDFNLVVPIVSLQRRRLWLEDELQRLQEISDNK